MESKLGSKDKDSEGEAMENLRFTDCCNHVDSSHGFHLAYIIKTCVQLERR